MRTHSYGLLVTGLLMVTGGCDGGGGGGTAAEDAVAEVADTGPDPCEGLGPDCEPLVRRGDWTILYLHGTPWEMGFQQGTLLHDRLAEGVLAIQQDLVLAGMKQIAEDLGLVDLALEASLPEILEECEGMAAAAEDVGWTLEDCMILNFGDVIAEFIQGGLPEGFAPGCSQVVASGPATADGRLYHLRILDWARIDFILENPVVFVRQPEGGVPHVVIGFPGNLSPYQGMNGHGVVSASNEVDILDPSVHDATGVSHVQLQARILATAESRDEAASMLAGADHMTLETLVISDALGGAVYELAPAAVGVREQAAGLVYATNHFLAPSTEALDEEPPGDSTALRFDRLAQLLEPDAEGTLYGSLDPETLVTIARDRVDPTTGAEVPADVHDDGGSLATNGALYVVIFDPLGLRFWVAAGKVPVPAQPLVGFSLGELLGWPGHEGSTPEDLPGE